MYELTTQEGATKVDKLCNIRSHFGKTEMLRRIWCRSIMNRLREKKSGYRKAYE